MSAFFCVFAFVFSNSMVHANELPSAFDLKKVPENWGMVLSPDGQYYAYVNTDARYQDLCLKRKENVFVYRQHLRLIRPRSIKKNAKKCNRPWRRYKYSESIRIVEVSTEKTVSSVPIDYRVHVDWLEWGTDERLLISVSRHMHYRRTDRETEQTNIVSLDVGNQEILPLLERSEALSSSKRIDDVVNFLPGDQRHIIVEIATDKKSALFRANLETGEKLNIATGGQYTFYWFTDTRGNPVMRMDCSSRSCKKINVLKYVGSTSSKKVSEWILVRSFKTKPNANDNEFDFWPVAPTSNPSKYYVIDRGEDEEFRNLKVFDINTQSYASTDLTVSSQELESAITDSVTGELLGVTYYKDRYHYEFIEPDLQRSIDYLNHYFGESKNFVIQNVVKNNQLWLLLVSGPGDSGAYYLYNRKDQSVRLIKKKRPGLDLKAKSKTDILSVTTRDGKAITAYLTYPLEQQNLAPLIVMPHGGPEARDYFEYSSIVDFFVSRGYQILQPNFRGSYGYGRSFAEAGRGEWDGVMHTDLTDSVEFLWNSGRAVRGKTCIVGYSYGGYAALLAATKTPDMYQCVIAGGAVSDLSLFLRQVKKQHGKDSQIYQYWLDSINPSLPIDGSTIDASPIGSVNKAKAPILLIHGEKDTVVKYEQSKKMFKALKNENKTVTFLKLESEDHNDWLLEHEILYLETMESFLDEHLK